MRKNLSYKQSPFSNKHILLFVMQNETEKHHCVHRSGFITNKRTRVCVCVCVRVCVWWQGLLLSQSRKSPRPTWSLLSWSHRFVSSDAPPVQPTGLKRNTDGHVTQQAKSGQGSFNAGVFCWDWHLQINRDCIVQDVCVLLNYLRF